jgi:isoleucyl-tRNA synthetase
METPGDRPLDYIITKYPEPEVDGFYADFEPTKAARAIQEFVDAHFSNWYIRLSRRRFWRSDNSDDKLSAYQTLYTCLITIVN